MMMLPRCGIFLLFLMQSAFACLPVSGDRIVAQDIVPAVPEFAALPGNTVLSYSPMPGVVRTFTRSELESIAHAYRIALGPLQQVCFSIPQWDRLPEAETIAAMRRALPQNATLQIVELPKSSVPSGEIAFPLEGMEPPQPSDPSIQTWKGYVRYAGTRRQAVWARVRVTVERSVVVAARALKPGETVAEDAVAVERQSGPLKLEQMASAASQAVGRTVLRSVKAGEPVPLARLDQPPVIHRGDPVKVEVVNGTAFLLFSAVAETNARDGEPVQLRNPASGKIFRARAAGVGKAKVSVGNSITGKSE